MTRFSAAATANIGIAVDTERGLLVPVLRDPSAKSLIEASREASTLMAKAKTGAISADDMAGGAFTITNLGAYGVDAFTPIINLPECAILGVGRIAPRPAVWQGQIAIRAHGHPQPHLRSPADRWGAGQPLLAAPGRADSESVRCALVAGDLPAPIGAGFVCFRR